eukprot:10715406-Alexandrium_andersonii.AAC.1
MSASLVGSEMCIRDSPPRALREPFCCSSDPGGVRRLLPPPRAARAGHEGDRAGRRLRERGGGAAWT